jgi:hypothetical protein
MCHGAKKTTVVEQEVAVARDAKRHEVATRASVLQETHLELYM